MMETHVNGYHMIGEPLYKDSRSASCVVIYTTSVDEQFPTENETYISSSRKFCSIPDYVKVEFMGIPRVSR